MFLRYNISNAKIEKHLIDVSHENITVEKYKSDITINFTTNTPHNLSAGDTIIFSRDILTANTYTEALELVENNPDDLIYVRKKETIYEKNKKGEDIDVVHEAGYYKLNDKKLTRLYGNDISFQLKKYTNIGHQNLAVSSTNLSRNTFSITYQRFIPLYIRNVIDGVETSTARTINEFPLTLNNGDKFILRKHVFSYLYKREATEDDYINHSVVSFNIEGSTDFIGSAFIYNSKIYEWDYTAEEYECTFINPYYFECPYGLIFANEEYMIEDTSFFDSNGQVLDDILFYEDNELPVLTIPLTTKHNINANNENLLKTYFKEKKEELIPGIIDYEKRCFSPYYKNGNNGFAPVREIKFNLFFRDRSGNDNWVTTDIQGWNQCKIDETGNFIIPNKMTSGDVLGYLNFTDDDIFYRKAKVSKTFLRLSFYDSIDPLNQSLLFYSTIFLDAGNLYNKFIKNGATSTDTYSMVKDETLGDDALTASFTISDKFEKNRCSEGFYLYLFPNWVKDDKEVTIYMKVEFSHAENGYTIPFIYPNDGYKGLDFTNKGFPFSLLNQEDGDLTEFYRQLYIPLTIKYDEKNNDYIYYFNIIKNTDDKIMINLYEPKLNPIE